MSRDLKRFAGTLIAAGALILGASGTAHAAVVSNINPSGPGSIGDAVTATNSSASDNEITFAPGVTGQITLTGQLTITDSVSISGPGADKLTISGNNVGRIFQVNPGGTEEVRIDALTLTDGRVSGDGGAIRVDTGTLFVSRSVISSSEAVNDDGGAIANYTSEDLEVVRSTISGNSARYGGGIIAAINNSDIQLDNSTVSGNSASIEGGGIWFNSLAQFNNSTIAGNTAGAGGGVAEGGNDFASVLSTIIADNSAPSGPDYSGSAIAQLALIESTADTALATFPSAPVIVGQDPQLGPLQNNGGTTQTRKLSPTSPAIDQGFAETLTDQRGQPRLADILRVPNVGTAGPGVDIGSVELTQAEALLPVAKCKKRKKKGKAAGESAKKNGKKKKKCKKKRKKR